MTETALVPFDHLLAGLQPDAYDHQYRGLLASKESRNLVTRPYSTTREEAAAVDHIVGSPATLYTSANDFVRHAVFELLMTFDKAGFPDNQNQDITSHIKNLRSEAHRLQLRQDFSEALTIYEASLSSGLEIGDYVMVQDVLTTLEGFLERTPDRYWQSYLKRTILKSVVVKGAIDALFEYVREHPVSSSAGSSEKWQLWLEGLVTDD